MVHLLRPGLACRPPRLGGRAGPRGAEESLSQGPGPPAPEPPRRPGAGIFFSRPHPAHAPSPARLLVQSVSLAELAAPKHPRLMLALEQRAGVTVSGVGQPRAEALSDLGDRQATSRELGLEHAHTPTHAADVVVTQADVDRVATAAEDEADERDRVARPVQPGLVWVQAETQLRGPPMQARHRLAQTPGVIIEDEDVITITDEAAEAQVSGEEVIERREVEVGPDLRGQRPDRQPVRAPQRREELVAREVEGDRLDRVPRPGRQA
jgi:hypothetical protein